jgi:acetyl-CoA carboxylase carboxyl transferase subunit alpha
VRIKKNAEPLGIPVNNFIDTPGAYTCIGSEERGKSEAIARNLFEMAQLKTPIISTVIGEGGSGGALAVGVADHLMMLQYSIYSVISPEGCASILWKSAEKASDAAATLGVTSERLKELKLIDEIVPEPLGGAHRDVEEMASRVRKSIETKLKELESVSADKLIERRQKRILDYGEFEG